MKAWVTKYALTVGVFEVEGEMTREGGFSYLPPKGGPRQYAYGNDFFMSEKHAKERAEEMRARKMKSLRQQLEKLQAMSF